MCAKKRTNGEKKRSTEGKGERKRFKSSTSYRSRRCHDGNRCLKIEEHEVVSTSRSAQRRAGGERKGRGGRALGGGGGERVSKNGGGGRVPQRLVVTQV